MGLETAERLGRELGTEAGLQAGVVAGGDAGAEAGKLEVKKHNVLEMKPEEIDALKKTLDTVGKDFGKPAGEKAGIEAASKINIPSILEQALAAAKKASDEAKALSQA